MDNKNYRLAAYKAAVEDVSELWSSFETVGIDEATDCTTEPWNGFEVGTPRAKLVSWFAGAYGKWIEDPLIADVPGLKQEDLHAAHKIWDEYCGVDADAVMHPESLTAATTGAPYMYLAIVYYSFDPQVYVTPFATYEEACAYTNELADEELHIDTEENGWDTELVNSSGKVQVITHFQTRDDVVTYKVASVPVENVRAVLKKIS